jgi:hypothetical protein
LRSRRDIRVDIVAAVPNILIRNVPSHDLEQIRAAAAGQGTSLQSYLLEAVRAQAAYLRRQAAIVESSDRVRRRPHVPETERQAVLDAIDAAQQERAGQLAERQAP